MDKEKVHEVVRLCDELKKRAKIAGRKGWLAYPVRREKVQRGHNAVVLDSEIRAVIEDGQFVLAR